MHKYVHLPYLKLEFEECMFEEGADTMTLAEIEEQIVRLSPSDKIQLVKFIAEIIRRDSDASMLLQLVIAAESTELYSLGPLEAYDTAKQLQQLLVDEER